MQPKWSTCFGTVLIKFSCLSGKGLKRYDRNATTKHNSEFKKTLANCSDIIVSVRHKTEVTTQSQLNQQTH